MQNVQNMCSSTDKSHATVTVTRKTLISVTKKPIQIAAAPPPLIILQKGCGWQIWGASCRLDDYTFKTPSRARNIKICPWHQSFGSKYIQQQNQLCSKHGNIETHHHCQSTSPESTDFLKIGQMIMHTMRRAAQAECQKHEVRDQDPKGPI